jgi:hypothetical protein
VERKETSGHRTSGEIDDAIHPALVHDCLDSSILVATDMLQPAGVDKVCSRIDIDGQALVV